MLLLSPRLVRFASLTFDSVTAVAIDRLGTRTVADHSDAGPHVVFADVPEQRVNVTVTQDLDRDAPDSPRPGDSGTLILYTAPSAAGGARKKLSAQAVVTGVTHELSQKRGALRTVAFVLISPDGSTDPITLSDAESQV